MLCQLQTKNTFDLFDESFIQRHDLHQIQILFFVIGIVLLHPTKNLLPLKNSTLQDRLSPQGKRHRVKGKRSLFINETISDNYQKQRLNYSDWKQCLCEDKMFKIGSFMISIRMKFLESLLFSISTKMSTSSLNWTICGISCSSTQNLLIRSETVFLNFRLNLSILNISLLILVNSLFDICS